MCAGTCSRDLELPGRIAAHGLERLPPPRLEDLHLQQLAFRRQRPRPHGTAEDDPSDRSGACAGSPAVRCWLARSSPARSAPPATYPGGDPRKRTAACGWRRPRRCIGEAAVGTRSAAVAITSSAPSGETATTLTFAPGIPAPSGATSLPATCADSPNNTRRRLRLHDCPGARRSARAALLASDPPARA